MYKPFRAALERKIKRVSSWVDRKTGKVNVAIKEVRADEPPPSFTAEALHGKTCIHFHYEDDGDTCTCKQCKQLASSSGGHGWLCETHGRENTRHHRDSKYDDEVVKFILGQDAKKIAEAGLKPLWKPVSRWSYADKELRDQDS